MDKQKDIDHKRLAVEDKLWILGELEHQRRHCLRSARVTTEKEVKLHYYVKAEQAQRLRRKVQATLGDIDELDWCVVKSAMALKQLNYETFGGDMELFEELEEYCDSQTSHAFGLDLTGCSACVADQDSVK